MLKGLVEDEKAALPPLPLLAADARPHAAGHPQRQVGAQAAVGGPTVRRSVDNLAWQYGELDLAALAVAGGWDLLDEVACVRRFLAVFLDFAATYKKVKGI